MVSIHDRAVQSLPDAYTECDYCHEDIPFLPDRIRLNVFVPGYEGYSGTCLSMIVAAKDEQHAVKIVNEHRIQLIAEGQWKSE